MKRFGLFLLAAWTVVMSICAQSAPPATAQTEEWYVSYNFTSGDESETATEAMQVAFDGDDIYFNFPNPITGNTWMKGTRDGAVVTFAKGQTVGTYGGTKVYYMGQNEDGLCDIVFNYDEANGIFYMTDMWLLLNGSLTQSYALGYFSLVVVSKTNGGGDADATDYVLTGKNVNPSNESQYEEINEVVKVRIDGSSIAIQGLSAYDASAWLTGTISNGVATFAKRQSAGSYNNTPLYFIGYDGSEQDVTFSYDEASGMLVAQQYILCITEDGNTYQMLQDVVLTPGSEVGPAQPEVVVPPTGMVVTKYVFTANKMLTDDEGNYSGYEEVKRQLRIGFFNNNTEVYVQGFCEQLPNAWVKGTVTDGAFGDKTVTFAAGQYYGQYGLYPLYLAARYGNEFTDMVFNYDPQTREFQNEGGVYLILNAMPSQPAPIEQYVTVKLTPGVYSGIDGITADPTANDAWYNTQGIRVAQPGKGIYIYKGKKVKK